MKGEALGHCLGLRTVREISPHTQLPNLALVLGQRADLTLDSQHAKDNSNTNSVRLSLVV